MQGTTIDKAGLTWYGGRDTTLTMKDVLYSDYIEMCSSAGDWSGFSLVKRYNRFYLIEWLQENRYPYGGYRLHIGKAIASSTEPIRKDEALEILETYYA